MKIEFLPDGSPDCPLVRLYDFNGDEVRALHMVFVALSTGTSEEVALEALPGVEPVSGCQVHLKLDSWNRGGRIVKGSAAIEWHLTRERWDNVAGLTKPFCDQPVNGYQWLDETGPVSLLLSADGSW